jgi:hypothetical protein
LNWRDKARQREKGGKRSEGRNRGEWISEGKEGGLRYNLFNIKQVIRKLIKLQKGFMILFDIHISEEEWLIFPCLVSEKEL